MYIEPSLKAMMITATFQCGWVISSTANVVSGQEFVEEELRDKCLDDIKSKVWELERYRKTDDKPLGYQEAMKIYKRICSSTTECTDCPLDSDNNGIQQPCRYLIRDYPEKAESLLKEWATEHPVKTNEQKCNEMFLETFGVSYAIALAHPDWWQQEYKNIDNEMQKENE